MLLGEPGLTPVAGVKRGKPSSTANKNSDHGGSYVNGPASVIIQSNERLWPGYPDYNRQSYNVVPGGMNFVIVKDEKDVTTSRQCKVRKIQSQAYNHLEWLPFDCVHCLHPECRNAASVAGFCTMHPDVMVNVELFRPKEQLRICRSLNYEAEGSLMIWEGISVPPGQNMSDWILQTDRSIFAGCLLECFLRFGSVYDVYKMKKMYSFAWNKLCDNLNIQTPIDRSEVNIAGEIVVLNYALACTYSSTENEKLLKNHYENWIKNYSNNGRLIGCSMTDICSFKSRREKIETLIKCKARHENKNWTHFEDAVIVTAVVEILLHAGTKMASVFDTGSSECCPVIKTIYDLISAAMCKKINFEIPDRSCCEISRRYREIVKRSQDIEQHDLSDLNVYYFAMRPLLDSHDCTGLDYVAILREKNVKTHTCGSGEIRNKSALTDTICILRPADDTTAVNKNILQVKGFSEAIKTPVVNDGMGMLFRGMLVREAMDRTGTIDAKPFNNTSSRKGKSKDTVKSKPVLQRASSKSSSKTPNQQTLKKEGSVPGRQTRTKWTLIDSYIMWDAISKHGNEWQKVNRLLESRTYHQVKDKGKRLLHEQGWKTGRTKISNDRACEAAKAIGSVMRKKLREQIDIQHERKGVDGYEYFDHLNAAV